VYQTEVGATDYHQIRVSSGVYPVPKSFGPFVMMFSDKMLDHEGSKASLSFLDISSDEARWHVIS